MAGGGRPAAGLAEIAGFSGRRRRAPRAPWASPAAAPPPPRRTSRCRRRQQKGDSTSLQHDCSARARFGNSTHASRPFREMIARPKISRNERKQPR
ncbi:hypothetical protein SO694_0007500 [Aureococcus anophagefferens]|uniref:Uncharacterized protein n=1 Tax=Aureococcus anophagefferens TaxID=44056 RepID=A0ABR1FHA0_AURAN